MQNAEKQEAVHTLRAKAQKKANEFSELFSSPIGKSVFLEIKEQFDLPSLCTENAHETIIRASQRDVIRWIEDVIARGE